MLPSTTLEAQFAISDTVRKLLPELRHVDIWGGQFDLEEIKRVAVPTPCAHIFYSGSVMTGFQNNLPVYECDFGVSITAKDIPPKSRKILVMKYLEVLKQSAPKQKWGYTGFLTVPTKIRDNSEFNGNVDDSLIAIWTFRFTQELAAGIFIDPGTLNDFKSLLLEYYTQDPDDEKMDAYDEVNLE